MHTLVNLANLDTTCPLLQLLVFFWLKFMKQLEERLLNKIFNTLFVLNITKKSFNRFYFGRILHVFEQNIAAKLNYFEMKTQNLLQFKFPTYMLQDQLAKLLSRI